MGIKSVDRMTGEGLKKNCVKGRGLIKVLCQWLSVGNDRTNQVNHTRNCPMQRFGRDVRGMQD
jgi:hypothetical protein